MTARTMHYGDRGADVRALQALLNHDPHHKPARLLEEDGVFGPQTAAACQQAKYWLGYRAADIKPVAGTPLLGLLSGKRPPSDPMRARASARREKAAAEAAAKPLRARALEFARADLGLHEATGNHIKYNEWWCGGRSDGAPYCVRAGSYWYAKAGSTVIDPHVGRYEGCGALLADAQAARAGVHLTSEPAPGAGFVIDFDGRSVPDHFGLYVADAGGGLFKSLEANATDPQGREGVDYHRRPYRSVWFVVFEH